MGLTERFPQQLARAILESIKSQIEAARSQTPPKSALAKACNILPGLTDLPVSRVAELTLAGWAARS